MKEELQIKLQAWVDGELPDTEDAALRRLVAADPEAARLVAELQTLQAAFREGEPTVVFPETRQFYWSKIQRQIHREEPVRPRASRSWAGQVLRWLAPAAGVATLAAALLLALTPSSHPVVLNQVSDTANDMEAHTFRDKSAGINFVVLQDAPRPHVHTRNDGSSFMIETE